MFENLGVAPSGGETFLQKIGDHSAIRVYKTLTHNGGTFSSPDNISTEINGAGTVSAGATIPYICYWGSSTSVPSANFQYFIANTDSTNLGADIVCTGYFRGGGFTTNTNNYKVTTPNWHFDGATTMNIGSSTIILNSTVGLATSSATSVLTAGPGCTISGTSAGTTFKSQNNWKVVGTCENLNVTNEELRVTGKVINCTGDIIQQHPSIDANQQLDYDTADDRDVMMGRDLDKNTELVT
jgi:hypothetical protein